MKRYYIIRVGRGNRITPDPGEWFVLKVLRRIKEIRTALRRVRKEKAGAATTE
jgi:hypothetical protein